MDDSAWRITQKDRINSWLIESDSAGDDHTILLQTVTAAQGKSYLIITDDGELTQVHALQLSGCRAGLLCDL